jgi:tetratricopeptide (TPR) repeat protein
MGELLVKQMLTALEKMRWPEKPVATAVGLETFRVGLQKVNAFRGDPKILGEALRTFQTGDSRPYALAGIAYTLLAAAREQDGSYAQSGLEATMHWLEQAQEMESDIVSINAIEALVYIYSGRYEDARLILDYLEAQEPDNEQLLLAEIQYWQRQGKAYEAVEWYEKAIRAAGSVPEKLRLRSRLGDCFLEFGLYDQALTVYQEAIHFDKENPWLWHNVSVVYWHQENYEEAARANKRALTLFDIPAARQMETALKEKMDAGGVLGRLFKR